MSESNHDTDTDIEALVESGKPLGADRITRFKRTPNDWEFSVTFPQRLAARIKHGRFRAFGRPPPVAGVDRSRKAVEGAMMILEARSMDEYTYTPKRVRYYLRNFAEVRTMCDSGASARGLLIPGPTPESPKIGARQERYHRADTWANIVVDLERAIDHLDDRLQWRIVVAVAQHGWSVGTFAVQANIERERAEKAFEGATERMARYLGWAPDES